MGRDIPGFCTCSHRTEYMLSMVAMDTTVLSWGRGGASLCAVKGLTLGGSMLLWAVRTDYLLQFFVNTRRWSFLPLFGFHGGHFFSFVSTLRASMPCIYGNGQSRPRLVVYACVCSFGPSRLLLCSQCAEPVLCLLPRRYSLLCTRVWRVSSDFAFARVLAVCLCSVTELLVMPRWSFVPPFDFLQSDNMIRHVSDCKSRPCGYWVLIQVPR